MVALPRNEIFAKRQRTIGVNLGAHFQVALRCGTDRPWLSAERNLVRHRLLEMAAPELSPAAQVKGRVHFQPL
jgi:hypothetical protein